MLIRFLPLLALATDAARVSRGGGEPKAAFVPGGVPPLRPSARLGGPTTGRSIPWGVEPLRKGERSSWRFLLHRQVRRGFFGPTWRAYDGKRKETVDVAMFNKYHEDASRQECRTIQRVLAGNSSYPQGKEHICRCLESRLSEAEGPFLVLENCGTSLAERLREQQWRHPSADFLESAREWFRASLRAVQFLSGLDEPMAHYNIGPETVMIDDDGKVRLVDFRLAVPSEEVADVATFVDSERGAPEHQLGGHVQSYPKERAWAFDVYSLGALFYDLLCRRSAADPAYSAADLKWRELTCADGTLGIGTEADWAVVRAALDGYDDRASPAELRRLLERAR